MYVLITQMVPSSVNGEISSAFKTTGISVFLLKFQGSITAEFLHELIRRPIFPAALCFHVLYEWAVWHPDSAFNLGTLILWWPHIFVSVWMAVIPFLIYPYHQLTSSFVTWFHFQWCLELVLCKVSHDISIASLVPFPHLYSPESVCWPGHCWVALFPDILFFHTTKLGWSSSNFSCPPPPATFSLPFQLWVFSPIGSSISTLCLCTISFG